MRFYKSKEVIMREIKFRVWCKNNSQWETDKMYLSQHGSLMHGASMIGVKKETHIISFFTGLYDKNGKEIYEGDILVFVGMGKCHGKPFSIQWNTMTNYSDWSPKDKAEIIGNIYENPELIQA